MYMKKIKITTLLMLGLLALTGCSDDDTTLTTVTNLSYEPTMGGAIIKFTAPESNDLLYVKAAYVNSLGQKVFRSTSIYDNKIEIDGLADETRSYPISVSAVDKWGGETSANVINVTPGRSYINIIKDNLEIHPMCGGLSITWENPAGIDLKDDVDVNPGKQVYVVVDYTDSAGVSRRRYLTSKQMNAKARIRGLFAGHYDVTFHVEDFAGNKTAQSNEQRYDVPPEYEFAKFSTSPDPVTGEPIKTMIWTLVPKLTTLQQAWEYRNAAIFDGIIDSKSVNTQNYAGTDADNVAAYGSGIPWDTDQVDIVVDMHQVVSISRLKAWQRAFKYGDQPFSNRGVAGADGISDDYDYYQPDNLKRFKLFGSMTLDEDGWFLIQDCDISTNSTAGKLPIMADVDYNGDGTLVNMPDNQSYQYAMEGHEWELSEMTDSVRYIRVRFVENWDLSKRGCSGLSEITLFGELLLSPAQLAEREAAESGATSRRQTSLRIKF